MLRQCATCLVMMGEKAPLADKSITHGICEECAIVQLRKMGVPITEAVRKSVRGT